MAAKKFILALVALLMSAGALSDNRLWYCKELDSAGLRYHHGIWTMQRFKLENHPVQQKNYMLELGSFGMLPDTTDCSFDYKSSIISCTDRYTLFNLNTRTGRAVMSHVLGWVDEEANKKNTPNDLSVTAIQCRSLIPAPGIE